MPKTLKELVTVLQSECKSAINWLCNNKIIVNPDKFQVNLLDKDKTYNTSRVVDTANRKIKFSSSVKLLVVHIEDELNFKKH